jgi:hypothetical protein
MAVDRSQVANLVAPLFRSKDQRHDIHGPELELGQRPNPATLGRHR